MMDLTDFEQAFLGQRPFASDRVTEPRLIYPDIEDIHKDQFDRLIRRALEVTKEKTGRGVTILGDSGVGKSHLLGRLYRWCHHGPRATAVFLYNLLVAPERLPRYLLASIVSVLTNGRRGDYGDCAFYELWQAAVRQTQKLDPEAPIDLAAAEAAVRALSDTETPLDRAIRVVLLRVGMNMHDAHLGSENVNEGVIEAGLDWLSGAEIEPERVALLGLSEGSEFGYGLSDDEGVKAALTVFADLSGRVGRPFILVIDQFDNLSEPQVQATTRFLHVLIDQVPNFLGVLSGVRANVLSLVERDVIPAANWDRVAEERVDLQIVSPDLAYEVVAQRIDAFRTPFHKLPEIAEAVGRDAFFPLTRRYFEARIGGALGVRPRQVIRWARQAWDEEADKCGGMGVAAWLGQWSSEDAGYSRSTRPVMDWEAVVAETVEAKRSEQRDERTKNPGSLPPDASNVEELLRRLFDVAISDPTCGLAGVEKAPPRSGRHFDLVYTDDSRSGVAIVMAARAHASTRRLRELANYSNKPDRTVVITHERRPIQAPRTSKGALYLQELKSLGSAFSSLRLDLWIHSDLDALVSVLLQARLGDIEVEWGRGHKRVTEDDVVKAWRTTQTLAEVPVLSALINP